MASEYSENLFDKNISQIGLHLYRSSKPSMSPEMFSFWKEIGIQVVIDLRTDDEVQKHFDQKLKGRFQN